MIIGGDNIMGEENFREGVPLTLTNLMVLVLLALVIIQAVGLIFGIASVTLGPVFVLFAVGGTAAISVLIFKKLADGSNLSKKDVFAILVSGIITLILLFFLREFVPEVFREGVIVMQSIVGF